MKETSVGNLFFFFALFVLRLLLWLQCLQGLGLFRVTLGAFLRIIIIIFVVASTSLFVRLEYVAHLPTSPRRDAFNFFRARELTSPTFVIGLATLIM
jgi:hypothetical protein